MKTDDMSVDRRHPAMENPSMLHQYIGRESHSVNTEKFFGNRGIRFVYCQLRERAPLMFRVLTNARISRLLGFLNFHSLLNEKLNGHCDFLKASGITIRECIGNQAHLDTPRKIFERKIRYWDCRPMPRDPAAVVSPCDARMLVGSFDAASSLFIKGKFFDFEELIGRNKLKWRKLLNNGDFAVFRLTPERYHYTHAPVAGKVIDFYAIPGCYHACHPEAVVSLVTPYSKNKRVITIIDTDVSGGTQVGVVAMVEVVALMIGDIAQCYSEKGYDDPVPVGSGLFVNKGCPKSLFRPGSSTVVLIFQRGCVDFANDIIMEHASCGSGKYFEQWLFSAPGGNGCLGS